MLTLSPCGRTDRPAPPPHETEWASARDIHDGDASRMGWIGESQVIDFGEADTSAPASRSRSIPVGAGGMCVDPGRGAAQGERDPCALERWASRKKHNAETIYGDRHRRTAELFGGLTHTAWRISDTAWRISGHNLAITPSGLPIEEKVSTSYFKSGKTITVSSTTRIETFTSRD